MDRLEDMNTFAKVVEAGSITGAAKRLRIAKSAVSRRVADLEDRLGTRLLTRTTAAVSVTEAGREYYRRAIRILAEVDEAEQVTATSGTALRGTIRITAPMTLTRRRLQPIFDEFLRDHDDVALEVTLTDRHVDIVQGGFDLAIRVGPLADSGLSARRLAPIMRVACASPQYLSRRGTPHTPADLRDHDGLRSVNSPESAYWRFTAADGTVVVGTPRDRLRVNNGEAVLSAALAGVGMCAVPVFITFEALRDGLLVPVMPGYALREDAVYAVYPHGRHLSRRVRVFIDQLAARVGERDGWGLPPRVG